MNKAGLLGYAGNFNNNGIVALQVETASCIENIAEIAAVPGVDILFLGQNDLCMSMGLYEKYEFPHMYTSPELGAATQKLVDHARKNNVILGLFLFGTARVGEFLEKGFTFISVGNDLHHVLTQAGAYVNDMEKIARKKERTGSEDRQRCSKRKIPVTDRVGRVLVARRSTAPLLSAPAKTCRASLDWADEDIYPYVVRGAPQVLRRPESPSRYPD